MTTYLLYDDALRSAEVRHEVGEPVADPIAFIEHDGKRIVIAGPLEEPIFATREDVVDEFWRETDLGLWELYRDESFPYALLGPEIVVRALKRLDVGSVVVPPTFRLNAADHLRAAGIDVVVDDEAWTMRRRKKTPAEIEGIERAQRAAETAMLTAARMLREAEPTADGRLRFEGEILTAELIRDALVGELVSQGAESEEIIVQSGDACFAGHGIGSGPILPDASCIVDVFPRDRRTGAYADMTRTFVPGVPSGELKRLHEHVRAALDIAFDALRPGTDDAFAKVARFFENEGFATYLSHEGTEPLDEGFSHSLGHGVGLQVHERPLIGRRPDRLIEGDVVAIEPGLYVRGVGGVRLEDTVLVTADGVEHFSDPYSYDLFP